MFFKSLCLKRFWTKTERNNHEKRCMACIKALLTKEAKKIEAEVENMSAIDLGKIDRRLERDGSIRLLDKIGCHYSIYRPSYEIGGCCFPHYHEPAQRTDCSLIVPLKALTTEELNYISKLLLGQGIIRRNQAWYSMIADRFYIPEIVRGDGCIFRNKTEIKLLHDSFCRACARLKIIEATGEKIKQTIERLLEAEARGINDLRLCVYNNFPKSEQIIRDRVKKLITYRTEVYSCASSKYDKNKLAYQQPYMPRQQENPHKDLPFTILGTGPFTNSRITGGSGGGRA